MKTFLGKTLEASVTLCDAVRKTKTKEPAKMKQTERNKKKKKIAKFNYVCLKGLITTTPSSPLIMKQYEIIFTE